MPLPVSLQRRAFLKILGAQFAALAVPVSYQRYFRFSETLTPRFSLNVETLPLPLAELISSVPDAWIDQAGYLQVWSQNRLEASPAPLAPTQWNLENRRNWHKLVNHLPWGIVLHWFGDRDNYDRTISGYLRGFDSLRLINGDYIRTSAHFLVGTANPLTPQAIAGREIGYLQTQLPAEDGTPFMASHLQSLDYLGYKNGEQYFTKALDLLTRQNPANRHLLQDLYTGLQIDPNRRTIGIEIAGYNFDDPGYLPDKQQIANVIGLVRALMLRYNLSARQILGHHELQIGKPDPGKGFLGLIRFLIGVLALTSQDEKFFNLVFGQYTSPGEDPDWAVREYFKFVRDYLELTLTPVRVYRWESISQYWPFLELLPGAKRGVPVVDEYIAPLEVQSSLRGSLYLKPESHEGIDLYAATRDQGHQNLPARLIGSGVCLYAGEVNYPHGGKRAIFRHRQPDGAEFLSIYGQLSDLTELTPGKKYPAGYRVGYTQLFTRYHDSFLHFALGYGASWEIGLKNHPQVPLNAGRTWIQQHYLDPMAYDYQRFRVITQNNSRRAGLFD
jgi:hypothetical protein